MHKHHDFYNVQVNLSPRPYDTVEYDNEQWLIEEFDYDTFVVPTAILSRPGLAIGGGREKIAVDMDGLKFVSGTRVIDYKAAGKHVAYEHLRVKP